MPQTGGRPGHHKEIGEVRHGNAEIGLRVVAVPDLVKARAASGDVEPRSHFGHFKTGRHHHNIGLPVRAFIADNLGLRKPRHALIMQGDMRLEQRVIPMIVEQDTLAIGRVIGQAFGDKLWPVGQLGVNIIGHFLPVAVIYPVHGARRMRPIRVFFQKWQQPVAIAPKH